MLLEIACFNLSSCYPAQEAGADRIELCSNYAAGGLTPDWNDIRASKLLLDIPVHVIIRPRSGNFVYSKAELQQMRSDILKCKTCNTDGVVFGILTEQKNINEEACLELIKLARPMKCTFHRAIDHCADIFDSVETLIRLGFDSVLTSGGKPDADMGKEVLKQLQEKYGNKIEIIAGGSVRSQNIESIIKSSGCRSYHSAAINKAGLMDEAEISKMKNIIGSV